MNEVITWITNNKETVGALVLSIYTALVRIFPTNKNLDIIGRIIGYVFPNKKIGGGTH